MEHYTCIAEQAHTALELILVPKNSKFSDHLSWNYYKINIAPSLLGLWPMKLFGWLATVPVPLIKLLPHKIEHQNLTVITTFWKIIYNYIILKQNVWEKKKYLKNLRSYINILEGPAVLE